MTEQEAIDILKKWCRGSEGQESKTAAVILFGIAHATDTKVVKPAG